MSLVKYSFWNLVTKIIILPINFVITMLVAKWLGPHDRGVYAFMVLIPTFLIPLSSFGIGAGTVYMISSKQYQVKQVFGEVLKIALQVGVLDTFLIFLLWRLQLLGDTGNGLSIYQILFLSLSVIFSSIYFFLTRLLIGDSEFKKLNIITLIQFLLSPLLLMVMILIFELGINGALYSIFINYFVISVVTFSIIYKYYAPSFNSNKPFLKSTFKYGIKGWMGDVAVTANVRFDQIILGFYDAYAIGIYATAVTMAELLWLIPDAVGPVLYNKIAALKNRKDQINLTNRIHILLLLVSVFLAIGLFFISKYLFIPYGFGEKFQDSLKPLLILLPGCIVYISAKVITKLFSGDGNIRITMISTVYGSVVSVILYFVFIPLWGYMGAALASTLGYFSISLFCIYFYKKYYNITYSEILNFKNLDSIVFYRQLLKNK